MNPTPNHNTTDADIRHFIYETFSTHTRPPTTLETEIQALFSSIGLTGEFWNIL